MSFIIDKIPLPRVNAFSHDLSWVQGALKGEGDNSLIRDVFIKYCNDNSIDYEWIMQIDLEEQRQRENKIQELEFILHEIEKAKKESHNITYELRTGQEIPPVRKVYWNTIKVMVPELIK